MTYEDEEEYIEPDEPEIVLDGDDDWDDEEDSE